MSVLKEIKRSGVYYLVRGFVTLVNAIPRLPAVFLCGWAGLILYALLPRDRHKIHRHLTLVFKDELSDYQKTAIGRNFFVNSGRNLVDVVRFKKYYRSEIKPLVTVEGLEHFDRAYKAGKGVFGVTGHIGNFELLAAYLSDLGYRCAVIGREMYDRRLDRLLVENREAIGLMNIPTTDSPRKLMEWLKKGGAVGVLIDTDSFRVRGMFIPVFGRLSNTPVGQTAIGLRVGAAFVPMACVRMPGNRYKVIIRPEIRHESTGDDDKDIFEVTRRCTQALEEIIRRYPDQWIWIHNRWHSRPPDSS
jgi:KDO2-lipid IV(A) lauroyltransferase